MNVLLRRVLAATVTLSVVMGSLIGCSQKGDSKPNNAGNTKTAAATKAPAAEIPKIYIYNNTGAFKVPGAEKGSNPEVLEKIRKYIIEKAGVEPIVEVPPIGSEDEKLNILLASGAQIDAFLGDWSVYQAKNAIIPLNDLLKQHGKNITDEKTGWPKENWSPVTDKTGTIWGIPRYATATNFPVWVRADWLKKMNLQVPKTIEEYEKVLAAFKEGNPSGNGTLPMVCDLEGLKFSMLGAFTQYGYSNFLDKDGKVKPVEFEPGFKDFVAKMNEWFKKGYIYQETFGAKLPQLVQLLKQNKIGSTAYNYSLVTLNVGELAKNFPGTEYVIAPIEGPKGKAETVKPGLPSSLVISKKAKNPEAVMKFINWQYENAENFLIASNGLKNEQWKYTDEKTGAYEVINPNNVVYFRDFLLSLGLPCERKVKSNNPLMAAHEEYLQNKIFSFDRAKKPFDLEVTYNKEAFKSKVPNLGDIERLRTEEVLKFIVGARPVAEYDKFLDQMNKAGMDKLIDSYTEQYNEFKKK